MYDRFKMTTSYETKKRSFFSQITTPLDSLLSTFPLVTYKREEEVLDSSLSLRSNYDYYQALSLRFDKIYPLIPTKETRSQDDGSILFLSDLQYSENKNALFPMTPEDNDALKGFLAKNELMLPKTNLAQIDDLDHCTQHCIILLSNDTLQLPLVIKNNGEPEIEESESEAKPNSIKTLSIILYLGLILTIQDIPTRTRYLKNINESYLVENKVFETLLENKWNFFYKVLQLNYKNPFLTVSLACWDTLNWVFRKQTQLLDEIKSINAHLYRKKTLLRDDSEENDRIINDSHLQSLRECIENDALLEQISTDLGIGVE